MIGKGWPRPCLVVTTSWTNLRGTLVHCLLYGRGYDRDYFRGCPYFGRSKEHKEIFFFFFGCSWGAWGSTPHINCFVAAWHASWPHVLLWLAERSLFRWNLFRFPALFKVDLLNPCLSLLISSFSFCVWFFWLYNCFYAFCSLSYQFLSLFLGTPLIYAFFLFEFYYIPFFCAPISFLSCVTFLNGGLLLN